MASREEILAQKERTSQSLIQAALALCAEEGFSSLSLRSVARRAGIAPTSFYRHFRDIDELGISMALAAKKILDECLDKVRTRMQLNTLQKSDSITELSSTIDAFIRPFANTFMEYFETHNYLLRLFFQERTGSSTALRGVISIEMDKLVDFLAEDLANLSHVTGKHIGDIRLLAETMLIIIMASGMEKMVNPESCDEIILPSMIHKLTLLLRGALSTEE